ncbi:hypothetical protein Acr_00g0104510 [Actinidia rufa]|uniref:Retrotransposon gag domain-containing protein n=1 Tax=Actinidia rufa TaxID=165716 RepID=A0A7J0E204_9ERIC|nr:hypothetical protein Acr_00g0104510 [Actinidia rufa]
MATTSDTIEHGGDYEGDTLPPTGKGRRGRSADIMASLEARLRRVELAMADDRDKVVDMDQRIDGLEGGHEEFHVEVRGILNSLADSWKAQMDALKDSFQAEIAAIKEEIKEVKGDWSLCKMAVTQGTLSSSPSLKVDIPRPKSYNGSRNARELDNFLWDLDQYFEATGIHEENKKIKTAPLFLSDAATLWWRRRHADMERGTCTIATWEDFKREIKRQFYPINSEHEARARLRRLSHKSTIREYVKEFSELLLEIPDMTEKESLFTFIDGLQSWAKLEVQRRGPQDLATAISIVESLIDFKEGKRNGDKPKLSCFLCDGNHFARDCPKRAKLSALIRDDEEEPHQEEAKVGSLRLLDAIKAQVGKSKAPRKGRMYVEAKVRGFTTRALIDTGASHNFMEVKEAKRLGLQFKEEEGWVKAVNTEARPIYGVARGVRLHIGEWCGQVDFTVVPMDDYPIVLGMEFLDGVRAFPIPFAETMCIMGEGSACMVPLAREASKSKTLSAMQLYKEDHSVGLETNAKIPATILTKSGGASESAQGRHADMAKAAKRRKKRSGKNRQVKSLNSKPKDSRDNPRGRDNSCHGSSRQATSTPRENPYGNSWTRAPNFEGRRRGRRQIGWGRMSPAHLVGPKTRPMEGQSSKQSLEPSRPFMRLPEAWR